MHGMQNGGKNAWMGQGGNAEKDTKFILSGQLVIVHQNVKMFIKNFKLDNSYMIVNGM